MSVDRVKSLFEYILKNETFQFDMLGRLTSTTPFNEAKAKFIVDAILNSSENFGASEADRLWSEIGEADYRQDDFLFAKVDALYHEPDANIYFVNANIHNEKLVSNAASVEAKEFIRNAALPQSMLGKFIEGRDAKTIELGLENPLGASHSPNFQ